MISDNTPSGPTTDARRWLESEFQDRPVPSMLVMIGLGDGQILEAIDRRAPDTRVLAIEPDAANSARFSARPHGDAWRRSGRLVYLADPDYAGAEEAWRLFPPSGDQPTVLLHPELARCEGLPRAKEVLKRILFGVKANATARRRFAPRYLTNAIRNVPAVLRGTDLQALEDRYQGVPAVIACAGPSLDAAIEPLQRLADRALLIAADTALRPLLTAGIAPPLVVGMDPGAANLRHFLGLPECQDTWLVSESALDPDAADLFADRTFWFRLSNHEPWPWLNSIGVDIGSLDVWGSVLTGAFQVACLAGCDPIVIVGADLAYTGGQPYARGTTYEFDWAWYAGYGRSLSGAWDLQRSGAETSETQDLHGAPTQTTEILRSFRDWMVARARRSGRRVINASGAGILFGDGIEHLTLQQALGRRVAIAPVGAFARPSSGVQRVDVASRLEGVRGTLAEGNWTTAPIAQFAEFSGKGFDAAAVSAALDHAVASLLSEGGETSPNVWSRFVSARMSSERSREMPEATIRLRAGLNRSALPTAPACADALERAAILGQALLELTSLCTLLLEGDEPQPVVNLPEYGQVPVALMYAWSDQQRWAIQAFEALLGKAWPPERLEAAPAALSRDMAPLEACETEQTAAEVAPGRPHAMLACRQLTAEWLRCASGALGGIDQGHLKILETLLHAEAMR